METLKTNLVRYCALSVALMILFQVTGMYEADGFIDLAVGGFTIGGVLWIPFRVLASNGLNIFGIFMAVVTLFGIAILCAALATWFGSAVAGIVIVLLFFMSLAE